MYFLHAVNSERQTRLLNVLGQIAMILGDLKKTTFLPISMWKDKKSLPRPQEANTSQATSTLHVLVVMQHCYLEASVRVMARPVVTLASYRCEQG